MSKIDLSKAKIGDKFRTEFGYVVKLVDLCRRKRYKYILERIDNKDIARCYDMSGVEGAHVDEYRLVEQVFDDEKGRAITDKILNDVEKVINGVAGAMPLNESAAIANLPREQLPENNEDNPELQRRQEVLKFADMLFFNQKDTRVALFRYDEAIKVAENIVNIRDEYLKEGKL